MSVELKNTLKYLKNKNNTRRIKTITINEAHEVVKEIERLNNIINEFDKWLLGEQMMFYRGSDDERLIRFGETKNKWLELKGSDKE